MPLDGVFAEAKLHRDLRIAGPLGNQPQHFTLATAQDAQVHGPQPVGGRRLKMPLVRQCKNGNRRMTALGWKRAPFDELQAGPGNKITHKPG